MFVRAYSLYDTKTGIYSPPFWEIADGAAVRVCIATAEHNNNIGKYPEDFVLYRVGEFDDAVGMLNSVAPVNLGSVASLVLAAEMVRRETKARAAAEVEANV